MLDSERVCRRRWSGVIEEDVRQWTMGGDSGGGGITALSDLSVVGEERLAGPSGRDRRRILPLRSMAPLAFVPAWVRGTVSCNHRSSSSLGKWGDVKSYLKTDALRYGDSRRDGGTGMGGGWAGIRRECLREIVVVDIKEKLTQARGHAAIYFTKSYTNQYTFWDFFYSHTILRQMIANSTTRRMQIAVSSSIGGFLLACLGSCTLDLGTVASVGLVDRCSADPDSIDEGGVITIVSADGSSATSTSESTTWETTAWGRFSSGICDLNIFPVPHFFRSASSSWLGGSGSSSRLVCWQCGQVQSLDLVGSISDR